MKKLNQSYVENSLCPEKEIGSLELADIIDVQAIQSLMDDFHQLVPIPMAIIDLKGKVLVGKGWQRICTQFHRGHPETLANCIESDIQLTVGVLPGKFRLYKCKNHMWDVSTPIVVCGKHIGNLFAGQFVFDDEPLDYDLFRTQAGRYGYDEQDYILALESVPRLSRKLLDASMQYFIKLIDLVSKLSHSNIQLARSLKERDQLTDSLQKSEMRLNLAQEISHLGSWELDLESNRLSWSDEVYRIFGLQPQAIEADYNLFLQAVHHDDRAAVDAAYSESLHEGRDSYEIDHRIVKSSGEIRFVHEKCEHFRDEAGRIVRSVGMVHDITEHKQWEEQLRLANEKLDQRVKERTAELSKTVNVMMMEVAERTKIEGRLRERESLMRATFDNAPFELWIRDRDGFCVMENAPLVKHWGSLLGLRPEDSDIPPETIAIWQENNRRAFEGEVVRDEAEYLVDGVSHVYDNIIAPIRVGEKIQNVLGINIDITRRKNSEKSLLRMNMLFETLYETNQAIIHAVDRNALLDEICRIIIKHGGFRMAWIGLADSETGLVHPVAVAGNGTEYLDNLRISVLEVPEGNGPAGTAIREGTFYICNDFLNDPRTVYWHEKAGKYGFKSSAAFALKMFGKPIGAIMIYAGESNYFDDQYIHLIKRLASDVSFALENLEREQQRCEANAALERSREELKQTELQLAEAKRLEAIGQLAGGVAHEVRNPLNAILSITEALFKENGVGDNPEFEPYIHHIRTQVKRLSHLMNDLLELGKPIPAASLYPVPLREACGDAVKLLELSGVAQGYKISLPWEDGSDRTKVLADGGKLLQVVSNLLENAFQHSPQGSEVVLESFVAQPQGASAEMAGIRICDSGSGIPADRIHRVFEPFYSSRKGGTGLGLALVRHFVEYMGGEVSIRNNDPLPGCTAEVLLPVAREEQQ